MKKTMTIAIATYAYSDRNYGQILQAYALQKHLENCGHKVYIINYIPSYREYRLGPSNLKQRLKYVIKNLPLLRLYFIQKENRRRLIEKQANNRNFSNFKHKYIHYSEREYTLIKELRQNPPIADYYITGSDQVWARCVPNPYPYLLQFIDTPNKLSYAASFGRSQLESYEIPLFKEELQKYRKIGVREVSGVEICSSLNLSNCQFTPDPTILLRSEEWKKLLLPGRLFKTQKKKIFIYSCYLHRDELIGKFVGLKDYEIIIEDVINNDKDIANLCIEDWIKAIYEADYVISNSFHATMFCLYLNTPFVTFQYTGVGSKMNTRLESILNQMNLMHHFVFPNTEMDSIFELLKEQINWKSINHKLDEMRDIGYKFLQDGLNCDNPLD